MVAAELARCWDPSWLCAAEHQAPSTVPTTVSLEALPEGSSCHKVWQGWWPADDHMAVGREPPRVSALAFLVSHTVVDKAV